MEPTHGSWRETLIEEGSLDRGWRCSATAVRRGVGGAPASAALSGTITADGSSTVGPYAIAAAEGFQKKNQGARVTVGISGTGGGFERFCRNETDLSNASRPMKNSEAISAATPASSGVAFTVANDGALGRRQQGRTPGRTASRPPS